MTVHQRGMVLVVSLLVLLILGIIASTVARTNVLQLHMAGNEEARIAAQQLALAAVDAVLSDPANLSLQSVVGHRVCSNSSSGEGCDERTFELGLGVVPAIGRLDVAVVRLAPHTGGMPVMVEGAASSAIHYRVAKFEVQVVYDATDAGLGRSALAQGVLRRLPVPAQMSEGTL